MSGREAGRGQLRGRRDTLLGVDRTALWRLRAGHSRGAHGGGKGGLGKGGPGSSVSRGAQGEEGGGGRARILCMKNDKQGILLDMKESRGRNPCVVSSTSLSLSLVVQVLR